MEDFFFLVMVFHKIEMKLIDMSNSPGTEPLTYKPDVIE
jgi:hypothetical protein